MTTLKGKNMKTTKQYQVGSKHLITDSRHKTFKKKKKDMCIQIKTRSQCEKCEPHLCLGGKMRSFSILKILLSAPDCHF